MLKVCYVSSWWFFYFPGQMLKNVIAIFAALGSSSFSPRYALGTGVQVIPGARVGKSFLNHWKIEYPT